MTTDNLTAARITQRLAAAATTRLSATLPHRRNRVALLWAAGCFLVLLAAGAVTNARQARPLPPTAAPPLILVWTPSPAPTPRPLPTATLAPTQEPVVVTVVVEHYIEVQGMPEEQPPEPTAEPWHPPLVYGEVTSWDGTTQDISTCGGPDVVPPACH